jgi:hypothetical protein
MTAGCPSFAPDRWRSRQFGFVWIRETVKKYTATGNLNMRNQLKHMDVCEQALRETRTVSAVSEFHT